MNHDDAVLAANRAANAVMMLPRHQSWVTECFGWRFENKAEGLRYATDYVRKHADVPAEALYIEMRGKVPDWRDARALVRAAVEVFVGTLRICDKLAAALVVLPPAPAQHGFLSERDDEMADGMDERI